MIDKKYIDAIGNVSEANVDDLARQALIAVASEMNMSTSLLVRDVLTAAMKVTGLSRGVLNNTLGSLTTNDNYRRRNKRCTMEKCQLEGWDIFRTHGIGRERTIRLYDITNDPRPWYYGDPDPKPQRKNRRKAKKK